MEMKFYHRLCSEDLNESIMVTYSHKPTISMVKNYLHEFLIHMEDSYVHIKNKQKTPHKTGI